jgi:hypothetical protein
MGLNVTLMGKTLTSVYTSDMFAFGAWAPRNKQYWLGTLVFGSTHL